MWHAGALAAAVTIEGRVAGEQRNEFIHVAVLAGGEKPPGQFGLFLARDFEARLAAFDSMPGSPGELAAVRLALPDDSSDVVVVVVEYFPHQKDSPFDG